MSDRWQYVVGGIISLVLAMAYLALTDEASRGGAHEANVSVAPDQTQETPSSQTESDAGLQALTSVASSAVAPIESIGSALTPEAISLNDERVSNDNIEPTAVLALPSPASGVVGQKAASNDQTNSESPALDSIVGP